MDHLRHEKHKNKQKKKSTLELENNFKPSNIFINDMDKLKKRKWQRRGYLRKIVGVIGTID